MAQVSIVIPTLNEADNIDPLLTRLCELDLPAEDFEIIVVDDNSSDGTPAKVRAWEKRTNVRLIERREKPGLTRSILAGTAAARGNIIVVMDADLSHPPERLPALIAPALAGSCDIAIGSRYVPGGGTEGSSLTRRWLSRLANWLARPLCDVNDATSGYFVFRRELPPPLPNPHTAINSCSNCSWPAKANSGSWKCPSAFAIAPTAPPDYHFARSGPTCTAS